MIIKGTKGKNGKNKTHPTAGGNGGNANFTQNGQIYSTPLTVEVNGGDGGKGGDNTTLPIPGPGANGGNGGNASASASGNIFNTGGDTFSITATGGDGGVGGAGSPNGTQGNGGNATVTMNGNILQPSGATDITLAGIAVGGFGNHYGNATASLHGNILQGNADTATLTAQAYANGPDPFSNDGDPNFGTKRATLTGNIVQGNITDVMVSADTYNPATPFVGSNGTAVITGNIVQTSAASGTVTLEASGQHIDIEKNKITVDKQDVILSIGEFGSAYDAKIKNNIFTGKGTNTFTFSDTAYPGPRPTPDSIVIDLDAQTFMFNGDNNKLRKFVNATVSGDNAATISGDEHVNILTGGGGDDDISGLAGNDKINGSGGNDLLTGGAGNDTIDGGAGLFDTAVYSGTRGQYTITFPPAPNLGVTVHDTVSGRDGNDSLTNVEFLKFSDGLYDVATGVFTPNTPVNHAPAGTDNTIAINEDNSHVFTAAEFGFTDPGDLPANNFLSVEITTLPANGTLSVTGNPPLAAGDFVSVADINAGKLVFTPAANANGPGYGNFTFQVKDDGGTAGGGVDTDPTPNTMTINVTPVNDAPAGTDNAITINEDSNHIFTAAEFGFTDPNDIPANNFLSVEITTLPANGTLSVTGNPPLAAGDFVSVADIMAGKLVFTPASNANGAGYGNFTFQVQDDGGTANGGVDLDQSPNTMTINVTSVNDAPAGTDNAITLNEDSNHIFTAAEFGFTDPNDIPANNFLDVEITTLPANGTLSVTGNPPLAAGDFVSVADIMAGKLVFTPAANANGAGYGDFTFQVRDDGGTANGGVNLDQSPNNMVINVTSVNDAPAGTDNSLTVNENGSYIFTVGDFGFTDPNDIPANNFLDVKITTLPANGTLSVTGNPPLAAGDSVSVADILAGKLVFTPAPNASGMGYGNFTFQVQDDGGTANGGVDLDQSPNLMTIDVAPVLVVGSGPGQFTTIQAAINAANPGDTIIITDTINGGVYNENVNVNKAGLTLIGQGSVTIEGTFTEDNGNFAGPLSTWLQTAPGYSNASGTGVTVSADNVTLQNITVDDFLTGISVSGASVSGLTLDGVTTQHSVQGFTKPDTTALSGLNITNSTFQDEYIGAGFYNDTSDGLSLDTTDTTIQNSQFTDIDAKGIYMETAQGNTTLDGLTMNNVGEYGGVPSFGANGKHGNGIDLNLKYHTYTGTVDISGFTLTNVGTSNGQGIPTGTTNESGAIVVEGRDDPASYNTIPADVSGLTVNIHDGSINGTSTGIRAGEIKASPADNDTGPSVDISNVTITGATVSEIDNHTTSLMTVNGTAGGDTYLSALMPTSTGDIVLNGLDGNDTLGGGLGTDQLNGGNGDDILIATPGGDTLDGGAPGLNGDTADFRNATAGITLSLTDPNPHDLTAAGLGMTTLNNIQNLTGSNFNDTLAGDAGANILDGGAGDDILIATAGGDTLTGGGFSANGDTADFRNATAGITLSLLDPNPHDLTAAGLDSINLIGIQNLTGSSFADTLTGDAGNNILDGGAGNDTLIYTGGQDTLIGGGNGAAGDAASFVGYGFGVTVSTATGLPQALNGADSVTLSGIENLTGTSFADTLTGDAGDNVLNGGGGNDTLVASGGSDTLNGQGGNSDTADFSAATNAINLSTGIVGFQSLGGFGQVKLVNVENLTGSAFNDVLTGDAGNNVLQGGAGDDTLVATTGNDTLNGDLGGNDTADFTAFGGGITVNLNSGAFQTFDGTDKVKFISVENAIGGAGNDTITGSTDDNILIGGGGNDTLAGNGGTLDIFVGGAGDDSITGSGGTVTDVAYYSGLETDYTITNPNNLGSNVLANTVTVSNLLEGTDTLTRVDRLKFLSPSHVSDLGNDGAGDLVYQDLGTGDITYVTHPGGAVKTLTTPPPSNNWIVIGTGQFTPDANGINAHKAGILLQDSGTGDMEVLTGIAGVNSTPTLLSSPTGTFSGWTAVTTGDFNGDAASDILLEDGAGGAEIAFLNGIKNSAIGTVDSIQAITTPGGANWSIVAAGDFDADGHSDILFRDTTSPTNDIVVDLMRGGTIESSATLSPGTDLQAVATGDFNGDGASDILFQNTNDGSAAIWEMNGTSQTGTVSGITSPGANFTVAGAQDINGDGVSDIIWHDALSGETQYTQMTTGGVVGATSQIGIAPVNTLHLVASTGGG